MEDELTHTVMLTHKIEDEDFIRQVHYMWYSVFLVCDLNEHRGVPIGTGSESIDREDGRLIQELGDDGKPDKYNYIRVKTPKNTSVRNDLEARLVLVNIPVDFSAVSGRFPNAVVAGFAPNETDLNLIQAAKGNPDYWVFRWGRQNNWDGVLKFSNWNALAPLGSGYKGVLTRHNLDGIFAERARKGFPDYVRDRQHSGCEACDRVRRYYYIQQYFLEGGKGIEALFEFSPLKGRIPTTDYPVIKRIPPVCGNWDMKNGVYTYGSATGCERSIDGNYTVFWRFIRDYQLALKKAGLENTYDEVQRRLAEFKFGG
jgi:hypothetical protein